MEFPEGRGVYPGSRFWKIQRGGGVIRKIPSVRGVWIFSGTTHLFRKQSSENTM